MTAASSGGCNRDGCGFPTRGGVVRANSMSGIRQTVSRKARKVVTLASRNSRESNTETTAGGSWFTPATELSWRVAEANDRVTKSRRLKGWVPHSLAVFWRKDGDRRCSHLELLHATEKRKGPPAVWCRLKFPNLEPTTLIARNTRQSKYSTGEKNSCQCHPPRPSGGFDQ